MQIINPSVEHWHEESHVDHVARCAVACRGQERSKNPERTVENLLKMGHLSMFRHESHYYIVGKGAKKDHIKLVQDWLMGDNPYVALVETTGAYYFSTNGNYTRDHRHLFMELAPYEVSLSHYCRVMWGEPMEEKVKLITETVRVTLCVVTQISTSRELNRTSPNNITEQSTRYVSFGKKGGITICRPHWWQTTKWYVRLLHRVYWKLSEWIYLLLLLIGFKPEDARGVLPLDTATRCVYTYTLREWQHILDLRLYNKTGKAHPNAMEAAAMIAKTLNKTK